MAIEIKSGSIYRNGDKWRAKVQKTIRGKTHTLEKRFNTKREAESALPHMKKELADRLSVSENIITNQTTIEEALDLWFNFKKNNQAKPLKPQTITRLRHTITVITQACGNRKTRSATTKDFQNLIDSFKQNGRYIDGEYTRLGHSSIKKIYDCLNALYKWLYQLGEVSKNPMGGVIMPAKETFSGEIEDPDIIVFNIEEIEKIKNEALKKDEKGNLIHRYGPLYILILQTGLRVGEALALKKSDIKNGILTIDKTVIMADNVAIIQPQTKTRVKRNIKLNAQALAMVELMFSEFPKKNLLNYSTRGNVISHSQAERNFNRLLDFSGVEKKGGIHTLRDTYATRLIIEGVDILTVSRILGHSSSAVTERHYIKCIREREAKATTAVEI